MRKLKNWESWSNIDPRQELETNRKIAIYNERYLYIGYVEIKHGYFITTDSKSGLTITETQEWPANWWWIRLPDANETI